MNQSFFPLNRREFFAVAAGATASAFAAPTEKKTLAAIVSTYYPRSHADVFLDRILNGYYPDGKKVEPRTRLVSLYTDQVDRRDLSRGLAAKHGFTIYPTVAGAVTRGTDKLAVDGVVLKVEHGNYPSNDRGQKLYPRYELFEQVVEVFRKTGKSVPVFHDKHFSWSWEKAKKMFGWSKELNFPLLAGSSIPVTPRRPDLEIPYDAGIEHAVMVGYGDPDAYGYHTLETLQCMVERRAGGETGIAAVEWLEGDAVWKWRDSPTGRWSAPLLEAALARCPTRKAGGPEQGTRQPVAFRIEYADGLPAVVFMLNGYIQSWAFAGRLKGQAEPVSTWFVYQEREHPRDLPNADGLTYCIEELVVTGKALLPAERTLIVTGALAFLFESRVQKKPVETPDLNIKYRAPEKTYYQRA
jgi:hypothetical protein